LVQYCSQQRGYPGIPLEHYRREHLEREFETVKPCAPHCTIPCVQRVSMIDEFREQPMAALSAFFPPTIEGQPLSGLPTGLRVLTAMLLPSGTDSIGKRSLRKLAARLLAA
jgi:hypothetical protein